MKRFLIGAVVAMVLLLGACGGDDDADPAAAIRDYAAAYNSGDVDAVMELFTDESVVNGHPFASRSEGLSAIRAVQVDDLAAAATENAYSFSAVEVSDDTVTWNSEWTSDDGGLFCQVGHTAVVKDGKIRTWTWPSSGGDCP